MSMKKEDIARKMITSILDTGTTEREITEFVEKCMKYPMYGIVFDLSCIDLGPKLLAGTGTKIITVSSYPLGGMTTEVKIEHIKYAISKGVDEIDIGLNYNALKSGRMNDVREDIEAIVSATAGKIKPVLMPQLSILTVDEKVRICELMLELGAKTVKTSTGWGYNTVVEEVKLLKRLFGDEIEVEVAGGVRTLEQAVEMLDAGATVFHSSTPFQIVAG